MPSLNVTTTNGTLAFSTDGTVKLTDSAGKVTSGTWTSQAASPMARGNALHCQLDGGIWQSLLVTYSFNDRNQLEVAVPIQPGVTRETSKVTFNGYINLENNYDVVYRLMDDNGSAIVDPLDSKSTEAFYVYGELDFIAGTDALGITFADSTKTQITGYDVGNNNVTTSIATSNNFDGSDLLIFNAATTNTINGADVDHPAVIEVQGKWDFVNKKLAFVAQYDNVNPAKANLALAFGGELRGVQVGFAYFQSGTDTLATFDVHGQHAWDNGSAQWSISLGHSGNVFNANLDLSSNLNGSGGKIVLKQNLSVSTSGDPGTVQVKLDLTASYTFKDGQVSVEFEGTTGTYSLRFNGTFNFTAGGKLTISLICTKNAGGQQVVLDLGYSDDDGVRANISIVLNNGGLSLKASVSWTVFASWSVGGSLVPDPKTYKELPA